MSVVVPRAVRRLAATSPAVSPAMSLTLSPALAAVVGAGDPSSSRVVYAMVVGLLLIGVAFIVLAFWILRQTRPDLEVLAPLERMGDGEWKRRDPSTQRRMLDEVRPEGAEPLWSEPLPPPLDAEFDQPDHPVPSWSDLGPGIAGDQRDPTPVETPVDLVADPVGDPLGDPVGLPAGDDRAVPGSSIDDAPDEHQALSDPLA